MTRKRYFFVSMPSPKKGTVRLRGTEHHHLARVSRIKVGDTVGLLDGRGGVYEARVGRITESETRLGIISYSKSPEMPAVDMALALTRAPRFDLAVEKCSELGVRRIIPFVSERSVWKGKGVEAENKRERLLRKIVAACKQSGQPFFPEVLPILDFASLLEAMPSYSNVYLADREGVGRSAGTCGAGGILGIVGPEGGLTPEERSEVLDRGAVSLSLGPHSLRSETAAICLLYRLRSDLDEGDIAG